MAESTEEQLNTLKKLQAWKEESKQIRTAKDTRIAKNLKLFKGIFRDGDTTTSKVRGKNKTFFRKIWATIWRLTATMYQAFMKDPETFRIEGRDFNDDPRRASVLQKIVEYRRDRLMNNKSLFIKLIWAIQSIFVNGWVCGKITWEFNEEKGIDGPKVMIYPFEQVFPDLVAETDDDMRYIHFLNYLTDSDLEDMGMPISNLPASAPESNQIRDVRFQGDIDPRTFDNAQVNYTPLTGGSFPSPGSAPDTEAEDASVKRHRVYESFWWENGKVMYGVSIDFDTWVVEPKESIYGDKFPIFTGQCLTEMHKLIGEGFPEPLEAPQESFNYFLNMRKDNIAASLTGHTFVSRYGGVDLDSLTHRRAGGVTLMDDVNAVKHEQVPDVTRSAYLEAEADDRMSDDMSGINKTISGQQDPGIKATTAQLNQTNSSAKIDLYVAIVGNTLFQGFTYELARQVAMFETDENVFRIANARLREEEENPEGEEIFDVGIDMDVTVDVGPGTVGQGVHVQQLILAMDRGIMVMQAAPGLAQAGLIPPQGLAIPNLSVLWEELLPHIGLREKKKYSVILPQPQQSPGGGVGSQPNVGGATQATNNELVQRGSLGGV